MAAIAFVAGIGLILAVPFAIASHQTFSSDVKNYGNGMHSSELIQLNSSGGTIVVFNAPELNSSGLIHSSQLNEVNATSLAQLSIRPNPVSAGGNGSGASFYYENLPVGSYYFVFFGNYSSSLQFYWTYVPTILYYPLYGGWALLASSPVIGAATYVTRKKSKSNEPY